MESKKREIDYVIAGASSGIFTRFICQPLDVLKIRFQLQVEPIQTHHISKYHSIPHAVVLIAKEEGISALWKGHVPAQMLSIVYGITQFYSYHIFTEKSEQYAVMEHWKNSLHFINGAMAGSIATVISYPFDTIRTRLVAQSSNNMVYRGMIHSCFEMIDSLRDN